MSQLSNHWATSSTPQVSILLAGCGVSGLAVTQAGAVRRRTKTFSGSESQWSVVNMCNAAFQGIRCALPSGGSVCAALVEQCQPEQGAPSGQRETHSVSAKKKKLSGRSAASAASPDQEEVILCFYNFYNVNNFSMFLLRVPVLALKKCFFKVSNLQALCKPL